MGRCSWGKFVLRGKIQQELEVLCCIGWAGKGSEKVTLELRPEGNEGERCGNTSGAQHFSGTSGDPDSGHAGKVELRGCQMDWQWDVRGRGGVTRTPELLAGAVESWDCPRLTLERSWQGWW